MLPPFNSIFSFGRSSVQPIRERVESEMKTRLNEIKNSLEMGEMGPNIFSTFIYGDGYNEALETFSNINPEYVDVHVHSLLILLNDENNVEYVKEVVNNTTGKNNWKSSNGLVVNIFQGDTILIVENNNLIGAIFIEIHKDLNISLMNTCFKQDNKLTMEGFIGTNYFMRNMTIHYNDNKTDNNRPLSINDLLFKAYDKLNSLERIDLIQYMKNITEIYRKCSTYEDPFYRFVAGNILLEIVKYINPNASITPPQLSTVRRADVEQIEDTFDKAETILNSKTIEQTANYNKNANITLRCILNHFIMYMNNIILEEEKIGFATKSGGEVYRYYGMDEGYTNDIDSKIFFYCTNNYDMIKEKQKQILITMLEMRTIISHCKFSKNTMFVDFTLFGNNISFTYKPLENTNYDTRVRSILIPNKTEINEDDYLHENEGIRLFSLDFFYGLTVDINNNDFSNLVKYTLETRASAAPLDVAFQPLQKCSPKRQTVFRNENYNDKNEKIKNNKIKIPLSADNHDITNKHRLYMNILSIDYLIKDLTLLLHLPERAHKNEKDKARINFLSSITIGSVNEITEKKLNSLCVENVYNLYDNLTYHYDSNKDEFESIYKEELECLLKTLTDNERIPYDLTTTLSSKRYKTKILNTNLIGTKRNYKDSYEPSSKRPPKSPYNGGKKKTKKVRNKKKLSNKRNRIKKTRNKKK